MRARMHGRRLGLVSVGALLACAGMASGQQQTLATWTGNGGVWFDGTNWDCFGGQNCIPDNGPTFTYHTLINGQGCFLNGSPTIDKMDVIAFGELIQQNNTALRIVGDTGAGTTGTFGFNDGTYRMESVGNNTDLVVTGGAGARLTFGGQGNAIGVILMSNAQQNRMYGASGVEEIVFGSWIELYGSGNLGANSARVINDAAVLRATQSQPLILDPGPGLEWENNSFIIAEFDGTVQVNPGLFNNINGWLGANAPDARLLINGGDVIGGQVQSGSGIIQLNGGSVSGTTTLFGNQNNGAGGGLVTANSFIEDMINYGVVTVANNVSGFHVKDSISNFGMIELASVGNTTDLIIDNDVALTSGGTVKLNNTQARIYAANGTSRLTNVNNLIRGTGQVGLNAMSFHNSGTVDADVPGQRLTIDGVGNDGLNQGVFRATNGGILRIGADIIEQTAFATVEAYALSLVELQGCTLIDGRLYTEDDGVIRTTNGSVRLVDVGNDGVVEIPNNTSGLRLQGTFDNRGRVDMLSVGNSTDLLAESDVTLGGGGEITMTQSGAQNRIYAVDGTDTITNLNNTIHGDGKFGLNSAELVNSGTVRANGVGARMELDPTTTMNNSGTLDAVGGGDLWLNAGTYTNSGQITAQAGSNVNLRNGALVNGGSVNAQAGGNLQLSGGRVVGTAPVIESGATGTITSGNSGMESGLVNAGVVTMSNNVSNTRFAGAFMNSGDFVLDTLGNSTDFVLIGDVTLTGGGTFRLDTGGGEANRVFSTGGPFVFENVDNLVHGEGQLGLNALEVVNQATIEADVPGRRLLMDTNAGVTNSGVLGARNGGVLRLNADDYTQVGGEISAGDGSRVDLAGANIVGGVLTSTGSGFIEIVDGAVRLRDLTCMATIVVPNNRSGLRLAGTIMHEGLIELRSVGNVTDLIFEGDTSIVGAGEIVLGDNGGQQNRIYAAAGDPTVTIGCTVRGSGQLGLNSMRIVNEGTIRPDGVNVMLIDPSASGFANRGVFEVPGPQRVELRAGPFVNEDGGTIQITDGQELDRVSGDLEQTGGTVNIDGTLTVAAGAFAQSGGLAVVGGVLDPSAGVSVTGGIFGGDGIVLSDVTNDGGVVSPGSVNRAVDDLTIVGEYNQTENGALLITLIGNEVNTGISATGGAMVAGELVVEASDGFDPPLDTVYEIVDAGGVGGAFAEITSNLPGGKTVDVVYESTRISVIVVAGSCTGDWNGDGEVNSQDFIAYLNDWSAQRDCTGDCSADLNGDEVVNSQDFIAFLNAWTAGC